jgi:hypothetical protein
MTSAISMVEKRRRRLCFSDVWTELGLVLGLGLVLVLVLLRGSICTTQCNGSVRGGNALPSPCSGTYCNATCTGVRERGKERRRRR